MNNSPYTVGLWTVKPGKENAFIAEWRTFAKWTAKNRPGAKTGYLLQDPKSPEKFVSFGPWENEEAIRGWRESPEFKLFGSRIKELCVEFQPQSLVLVATSDAGSV